MFAKVAGGVGLGLALAGPIGTAAAAEIVVMRGSETEVVSTARGGAVTVLRGRTGKQDKSYPERREAVRQPAARGFTGTGDNLWHVDARGRLSACWLTGTGYVNSLAVVCAR